MKSALLVIDAQQSFLKRPYWSETDAPRFIERLQMLIDRCVAKQIPVLQVFHVEEEDGPSNPFSRRSGYVKTLDGLRIEPTEVFSKSVHSAMFASTADGQSMDYWLRKHGIGHPDKTAHIRALNIIDPAVFILSISHALLVYFFHDILQTILHFLSCPGKPH